jgi:class 3 adenylate cyclase
VTRAEALIVLGRIEEAAGTLRNGSTAELEPAAMASAYAQLALLCEARGIALDLLDALRGAGVLHFCGHLLDGALQDEDERATAEAIRAELDREPVASGYGALAAGSDVLIAEALLERGAELHVVLPCSGEIFMEQSVRPWGGRWVERFERCLSSADAVAVVTPTARQLDDALLTHTSEMAMGLALLRARWLHAEPRQLAVWDGTEAGGGVQAGTAADVARWRRRGGRTVVITPPQRDDARRPAPRGPSSGRRTLAFLFADVAGYTKVNDEALPRFAQVVMDELAQVLARHDPVIVTRNTWGDAISVATETVEQAARVALDVQETFADLDPQKTGLPSRVAFRLGAHVGPAFLAPNAVRGSLDVVGEHVNRTARLEPVTPPGEVYVTDAFAAALELAGVDDLACDYVGHLPGAKDIGRMRMHRLRRTTGVRASG